MLASLWSMRGAQTWAILAAVRHKKNTCAVERRITWYDSKAAMAIRDMDDGWCLRHSNVWTRFPLHLNCRSEATWWGSRVFCFLFPLASFRDASTSAYLLTDVFISCMYKYVYTCDFLVRNRVLCLRYVYIYIHIFIYIYIYILIVFTF